MSGFKRKTLLNDFRAIKLGVVLVLALLGVFFVSNGVQAGTFSESFETYDLGKLGGQGNWTNYVEEYGFIVNNDRASEGVQSIISHPTSTDLIASSMLDWATTTGIGILSVDFLVEKKPNWAMVEFCYGWLVCVDIEIGNDTLESTKIILSNEVGGEDIILADNYFNNVWHRISFEYNLDDNWCRGSFDFGSWSSTTPIYTSPLAYFNKFIFRGGGEDLERIYFDNFTNEGECNSTCIYCDFNGCLNYETACVWSETESQCQVLPLGLPELPPLEDCSEYGLTDRLTCEIKNFFYRLFVPSPEKITELKNILDLTKEKFPYNYILATKDFFISLKNNLADEDIQFGILGVAGVIDFSFWNSTTTIGNGGVQKYLDIFKTFSTFIILFVFVIWAIHYLRKVWK